MILTYLCCPCVFNVVIYMCMTNVRYVLFTIDDMCLLVIITMCECVSL